MQEELCIHCVNEAIQRDARPLGLFVKEVQSLNVISVLITRIQAQIGPLLHYVHVGNMCVQDTFMIVYLKNIYIYRNTFPNGRKKIYSQTHTYTYFIFYMITHSLIYPHPVQAHTDPPKLFPVLILSGFQCESRLNEVA